MPINLYYNYLSAPSRAVMILAKKLGIKLNLINIDLFNNQQSRPGYELINPVKQVPCLDDNGFKVSESRVILTYLINRYSPDKNLYSTDANKRANIDRVLYSTAELFVHFKKIFRVPIREHKWPAAKELFDRYFELLKTFDNLISYRTFLAGDDFSLADISFICDITLVTDVLLIDISNVAPNIATWMKRMITALPEYEKLISEPNAQFKTEIERFIGRELNKQDASRISH